MKTTAGDLRKKISGSEKIIAKNIGSWWGGQRSQFSYEANGIYFCKKLAITFTQTIRTNFSRVFINFPFI
jgi:hypothetical protein